MEKLSFNVIARIYTDFPCKFGLPRQSGIVSGLKGRVIFEPEYRDFSAVRELSEFSHIWLLWYFSRAEKSGWSPTVRPPRLGGNRRVGVFATRSPNRPNPIALSAVRLERVSSDDASGPVLEVSGIDMCDGTPILDIKPYLSFADAYPGAVNGFADEALGEKTAVIIPEGIRASLSDETANLLRSLLAEDPRPRYHSDPERIYGFIFKNLEIKFKAENGFITVLSADPV